MVPSQLYADIPDLTDTELRIIMVVLGNPKPMTMTDVQQRTGRTRQVYEAVKSLEAKGWLVRQVANVGPIAWHWTLPRYDVGVKEPEPEPELKPAPIVEEPVVEPIPEPKSKPKPKPSKPPTAQQHPAVLAYMEITRRRPTHAAAELIASAITDVERWKESVKSYILRGWNPMNVNGMIQVYTGEITLKRTGNKRSSHDIVHQPPDVARAAFDEYLRNAGEEE